MWLMLQQSAPNDFVLATGKTTTVCRLIEIAFQEAGLSLEWQGKGLEEKGIGPGGKVLVEVSSHFFRPAEVDLLVGDARKAKEGLGWMATTSVEELIRMMVHADVNKCSRASE